jgi:hypothetical protein
LSLVDEGVYEMAMKMTNTLIDQEVNKTFFVNFTITINLPPTFPPFFSEVRDYLMFYKVDDFEVTGSILLGTIRAFNPNIEPTITDIEVYPKSDASYFDFLSDSDRIKIDYAELDRLQSEAV